MDAVTGLFIFSLGFCLLATAIFAGLTTAALTMESTVNADLGPIWVLIVLMVASAVGSVVCAAVGV